MVKVCLDKQNRSQDIQDKSVDNYFYFNEINNLAGILNVK